MAMQKVFKRAASQVAGASNKGAKVAAPKAAGYGSITSQGKKDASEYLGMASNGSMAGASFRDRSNLMGGWVQGNWQQAATKGGHSSVLGMAGSHAIRGAAWGGVAGGTIEAAQGGSFWDGAKQGAFNGAVGWTGARMAMKGAGVGGTMNPVKAVKETFGGYQNMVRTTGGKNAEMTKNAASILSQRQRDGLARQFMNANSKGR